MTDVINPGSRPAKRYKGPARLTRIPEEFQSIPGVSQLTTFGQLQKLIQYLAIPAEKRQGYVRLGCSVQHCPGGKQLPSSSTWAVSIGGAVEVMRIENCDPRSTWKWMTNPAREWNIDGAVKQATEEARENADAEPEKELHYVVAVDELDSGAFPQNSTIVTVLCNRRGRGGDATGTEEYLVRGLPGWWRKPPFQRLLFAVRLAEGEVFSGSDGCFWAMGASCRQFKSMSFADLELSGFNGDRIGDSDKFLRERAKHLIMEKVVPFYNVAAVTEVTEAVARLVAERVERLDLEEISHCDLARIAGEVKAAHPAMLGGSK